MFKKTFTKGRKITPGTAKAIDKYGNVTTFGEASSSLAYKCSYRLPLPRPIRRRLNSKESIVLSTYDIHSPSNITRLEYEINKSKELKELFTDVCMIRYDLVVTGWRIFFNHGKLRIRCQYLPYGNRKYTITNDGVILYEKVLDTPVYVKNPN